MGDMDRQRAEWLASRDADAYFERLAEERAGYGLEDRPATERDAAEAALQAIDRVCCQQLQGAIGAAEAVERITAIVGKWTDPDGPAGHEPAQTPQDVEFDRLQGPLPAGAGPVEDDDDLPF